MKRSRSSNYPPPSSEVEVGPLEEITIGTDLILDLENLGSKVCGFLLQGAHKALNEGDNCLALKKAKAAQDLCWLALHSGPWRDAAPAHRRAYALARLLAAAARRRAVLRRGAAAAARGEGSKAMSMRIQTICKHALKDLDMMLLMAGGSEYGHEAHSLINFFQDQLLKVEAGGDDVLLATGSKQLKVPTEGTHPALVQVHPPPSLKQETAQHAEAQPKQTSGEWKHQVFSNPNLQLNANIRFEIERINCPALHDFLKLYMESAVPVILTDVMKNWPALELWEDMKYLKSKARGRTVPIETGNNYLDPSTGNKLMAMDDFISNILEEEGYKEEEKTANSNQNSAQVGIVHGSSKIHYLAQHQLFDQIPDLNKDILTPDYCALVPDAEEEDWNGQVVRQAWLGPPGTISPLHTDPYHNLLAQVVGSKFIRLYAPKWNQNMYPMEGKMNNNSSVDMTNPDHLRFPMFAEAQYMQGVLNKGEMLYIPPRWWHYITSLETSFSVSFWWGKKHT